MGYAVDVIKEILNLTDTLNGKQQLCLIRRASNGIEKVFIVYNYVYRDKETIGLCFVFNDVYPQNMNYMFTFCGQVLSNIVNEGRVLYLDEFGVLHSNIGDGNNFSSLYKKHLAEARSKFEPKKGDFTQVPPTYFSNYKNQHVIFQLSDQSWTLSEALLYNNIVIVTEEIEEENINSMRSFIKNSNETVNNLNKKTKKLEEKIKELEDQLKKAEREKERQQQTFSGTKPDNKTSEQDPDTAILIFVCVIVTTILFNLVVPWFIHSMWPKLAVVLTGFGTYLAFKALNDNSNNKVYEVLGWSGAIAILLSTILTIYGIFGGFSPDTVDEDSNIKTVTENPIVQEIESEKPVSNPTPGTPIPNNFVRVSSGASDFYIDKFEVTERDYASLMGNNPSKYQGDSLPVHGMSVRDAVIYCNKKSEDDGLKGFYDISENMVRLKEDGKGYRLPTEREWILASKKIKESANDKPYFSRPYRQIVKSHDFKLHAVGEIHDKRRELFDVYGNVSELCVRSNGEIWGKGGSYRIALDSETNEDDGFKAAENLSSTIKLNADFGMRLVFVP